MKSPPFSPAVVEAETLPTGAADDRADSSLNAVAMRLQWAVKEAGGRDRVAAERGVAKRTLTRALNGESVRRGTLLEIARALNVPADWLLQGRGEFKLEWIRQAPNGTALPMTAGNPLHPAQGLFGTVDIDRLSTAFQSAEEAVRAQGGERNWRAITQVALLLYDEATRRTQDMAGS